MSVAELDQTAPIAVETAEIIPFPMPHARLGKAMEIGADVLVGVRAVGAVGLNAYIRTTPDYQSWRLAASFGGFAITDAIDGWMARTGRKLQGKDESIRRPWKSYPDHLADKALTDATTEAIAERELRNSNTTYGTVVAASAGVYIARDIATTVDRVVADIQNIDTRAQASGKKKALKQFMLLTAALSPVAKHPAVKVALGAGFVHTAEESVSSGLDLHRSFTLQRQTIDMTELNRVKQWRKKRSEKKAQHAHWRGVAEDAIARKGSAVTPRVLRSL